PGMSYHKHVRVGEASPLCSIRNRANRDGSPTSLGEPGAIGKHRVNRAQDALLKLQERLTARRGCCDKIGDPFRERFGLFPPNPFPCPIFPKTEIYFSPDRVKNRPDAKPGGNLFGKGPAAFQITRNDSVRTQAAGFPSKRF